MKTTAEPSPSPENKEEEHIYRGKGRNWWGWAVSKQKAHWSKP